MLPQSGYSPAMSQVRLEVATVPRSLIRKQAFLSDLCQSLRRSPGLPEIGHMAAFARSRLVWEA